MPRSFTDLIFPLRYRVRSSTRLFLRHSSARIISASVCVGCVSCRDNDHAAGVERPSNAFSPFGPEAWRGSPGPLLPPVPVSKSQPPDGASRSAPWRWPSSFSNPARPRSAARSKFPRRSSSSPRSASTKRSSALRRRFRSSPSRSEIAASASSPKSVPISRRSPASAPDSFAASKRKQLSTRPTPDLANVSGVNGLHGRPQRARTADLHRVKSCPGPWTS